MVKVICYVTAALCTVLAAVSFLDVINVIDMGMEIKNMGIGCIGAILGIFLGRNISHMERDEKDRNGPSLRR